MGGERGGIRASAVKPRGSVAFAASNRMSSMRASKRLSKRPSLATGGHVKNARRQSTALARAELTAVRAKKGEAFWLYEQDAWTRVVVETPPNFEGEMTILRAGKAETLLLTSRTKLLPANEEEAEDLASLKHVSEPTLCEALRVRYAAKKPYSQLGGLVLVSVNPLEQIAEGDGPSCGLVAERAFGLMKRGEDQVVVTSGESGAGKTEAAKSVTTRLLKLAGGAHIGLALGAAQPLLESFGNASTKRNANSSRFARVATLFFDDEKTTLRSAAISTFLLEETRVAHRSQGERNFHVLYQAVAGSEYELDCFGLLHCGTSLAAAAQLPQVADTNKAISDVGFSAAQATDLWSLLRGVLHLGNLDFEEGPEEDSSVPTDAEPLRLAAEALGVAPEALRGVICERRVAAGGENIRGRRSVKGASLARDAVARALYSRLFQRGVVGKINEQLKGVEGGARSFSIVDIFGFEDMSPNEMEQLLINYANEELQAAFNGKVFREELALFASEGLDVSKALTLGVPDNLEIVELFSAKTNGIFRLLDEATRAVEPADSRFLAQMHQAHQQNPFFVRLPPAKRQTHFAIRHFAGVVEYKTGSFVAKNSNVLPKDMEELIASTKLAKFDAAPTAAKKTSVASSFLKSMAGLLQKLASAHCSYVKCIKPNAAMKPGAFDAKYVLWQLKTQGLAQACEVLRAGYPVRLAISELVAAFGDLTSDPYLKRFAGGDNPAVLARLLLQASGLGASIIRVGLTKVFCKADAAEKLDALAASSPAERAALIASLKKFRARALFRLAMRHAQASRAFLALLSDVRSKREAAAAAAKTDNAASLLQRQMRGFYARKRQTAALRESAAAQAAAAEEASFAEEVAVAEEEEEEPIVEVALETVIAVEAEAPLLDSAAARLRLAALRRVAEVSSVELGSLLRLVGLNIGDEPSAENALDLASNALPALARAMELLGVPPDPLESDFELTAAWLDGESLRWAKDLYEAPVDDESDKGFGDYFVPLTVHSSVKAPYVAQIGDVTIEVLGYSTYVDFATFTETSEVVVACERAASAEKWHSKLSMSSLYRCYNATKREMDSLNLKSPRSLKNKYLKRELRKLVSLELISPTVDEPSTIKYKARCLAVEAWLADCSAKFSGSAQPHAERLLGLLTKKKIKAKKPKSDEVLDEGLVEGASQQLIRLVEDSEEDPTRDERVQESLREVMKLAAVALHVPTPEHVRDRLQEAISYYNLVALSFFFGIDLDAEAVPSFFEEGGMTDSVAHGLFTLALASYHALDDLRYFGFWDDDENESERLAQQFETTLELVEEEEEELADDDDADDEDDEPAPLRPPPGPPPARNVAYDDLTTAPFPAGVNALKREDHLSDADFTKVFKTNRAAFGGLPTWKQCAKKKAVGLF